MTINFILYVYSRQSVEGTAHRLADEMKLVVVCMDYKMQYYLLLMDIFFINFCS